MAFHPRRELVYRPTMGGDDSERREGAATVFAGGAAADAPTMSVSALAAPIATSWQPGEGRTRYRDVARLGEGGMGRVTLALDGILGRRVARKSATDSSNDMWLLSEAQINAQLEHPSIVPVHDVETDSSGRPSYIMRVVQGRTLGEVLARRAGCGTPPLVELLAVLRQVCLAVDYAHQQGVVHRDLKPANIIVGDFGEVYVLDWGVACILPDAKVRVAMPLPAAGSLVGSLGYMAPEQARGDHVDARADVFALGVILHVVLTGTMPFIEESVEHLSARTKAKHSVPPAPDAPALPPAFRDLVRGCLRREPALRPGSARAIAEAIDDYLDQERQNEERLRDATASCQQADEQWAAFEAWTARARDLATDAQDRLAALEPWAGVDEKRPLWHQQDEARELEARAAEALARCETGYGAALGRVSDHAAARRGLARLHHWHFCEAERAADAARMARSLELARAFDTGELRLELACESELVVETEPSGIPIWLSRYAREGPLLIPGPERQLGLSPVARLRLASGSYRVVARLDDGDMLYPLELERGRSYRVMLRARNPGELPEGMVLVPGGPFLASDGTARLRRVELPDFAIARFPCTLREYGRFLDALAPEERERRLPRISEGSAPLVARGPAGWTLAQGGSEGRPLPIEAQHELPAHGLSWESAAALARWVALNSGRPYRLPTALEWEKAMRGADGRPCPMGLELDYAFAKLRSSRPGYSELEPVGAFSLDESPYGVRDMAGGVAEWTGTFVDRRPPPTAEGAEPRHVFRLGCHWGSTRQIEPTAYLSNAHVGSIQAVGVRLALSLEGASSTLESGPMR